MRCHRGVVTVQFVGVGGSSQSLVERSAEDVLLKLLSSSTSKSSSESVSASSSSSTWLSLSSETSEGRRFDECNATSSWKFTWRNACQCHCRPLSLKLYIYNYTNSYKITRMTNVSTLYWFSNLFSDHISFFSILQQKNCCYRAFVSHWVLVIGILIYVPKNKKITRYVAIIVNWHNCTN